MLNFKNLIMKKEMFTLALVLTLQWNIFSQTNEKISFEYQSTELSSVIKDLDTRYDVSFSHSNHPELLAININAKGSELQLEAGLEKIFDNKPIKYRILAGQVVLRYDETDSKLGAVESNENKIFPIEPEVENKIETPEVITSTRTPVEHIDPIQSHRPRLFSIRYNTDVEDNHDDFHVHFDCDNDGPGGFEIYTSDIFRYHLSFKSGNNKFYSLVNLSSDRIWPWNYKKSDPQWAFGIGAGYKANLFRIPFRTELILNHINEDKFISTRLNELIQLRTVLGLPFLGTEITFGPTFNLHVSGVLNEDTNQIGSNLLPGWEEGEINGDKGVYYWIGGTIGILF